MDDVAPVERKVTVATVWALLASIGVALLNAVVADSSVLGPLPGWAQFGILTAAPPLVTFLGGYAAAHTPR